MEQIERKNDILNIKTIEKIIGLNKSLIRFQVSFNSDRQLVLKWFSYARPNREFMIVLDDEEAGQLTAFYLRSVERIFNFTSRLRELFGGDP
jgi:hypothetical protein